MRKMLRKALPNVKSCREELSGTKRDDMVKKGREMADAK